MMSVQPTLQEKHAGIKLRIDQLVADYQWELDALRKRVKELEAADQAMSDAYAGAESARQEWMHSALNLRKRNEKLERVAEAAELALAAMDTVGEACSTNLAGEDEEYITADTDAIREASDQVREALAAIDKGDS